MSLTTLKRKTNNGNSRNAPISGKGHLGIALNGEKGKLYIRYNVILSPNKDLR